MGAEVHIWALERDREELAASFGASGYWTADDPPPVTYDAVVDCTDDHPMPAAALARAEPAGRLVYIGIAGVPSLIDSRDLVLGDMTAVGILGASAGLAPAIEHYADGRVDPSRIVAVTVGLEDAAEALAGTISTGAGTKIHIDPALKPPRRECINRDDLLSDLIPDQRDGPGVEVRYARSQTFPALPSVQLAAEAANGGVTELRVHGVGGSPPDATLGDLAPEQVSGDAIAGFYRTSDHRPTRGPGRAPGRGPARGGLFVGRPDLAEQGPGAVAGAAAVPVRQPGGLDVLGRTRGPRPGSSGCTGWPPGWAGWR